MNLIKLLFVALVVLIISSVLSAVSFKYQKAYINVDYTTHTVNPYKSISLKAILDKNNIVLNDSDIVSSDINKLIKPLQIVKITRVTNEQKQINEIIPFRITWSKQYNSNLRKVELQKGVEKIIIKTINESFYNGVLHDTSVLDERTLSKEYYRLVLFNSKDAISKVYDLSKAKRMQMVATAYYPGDPLAWGDGTVTYLGQKMQRGIVAVDPKIIPLKTRLFISGYGYGYAGDTGNLIKGKHIDLGVNKCSGRTSMDV
jgi:3D (Asp-Asp-Asp) domain-containing protein